MFNTLLYTKKLEAVGISREQAETHIQIMADIVLSDLATKQDLKELEYRLVIRMSTVMGTMLTLFLAIFTVLQKFA